ncbi:polyketide synthase, partial [Colletotrichum sp. SAR 10_98]
KMTQVTASNGHHAAEYSPTNGSNGVNGHHSNGTNGHPNGHANGYTNSHTNGHTNGHMNGVNGDSRPKKQQEFEPIAICGMACRLPGGIHSPEELWEFLVEGRDARIRVPASRFNIDAYYSATKKSGTTNSQHGYYLDESVDLAGLDTSFFSMSRTEVEWLDPQQRLMLEVARESLDDAGEVAWRGKEIGVYIGSFGQDWYDILQRDPMRHNPVSVVTSHDFMISERISHEMDLHGPSMTIRTACSSALVSLNEACMAIGKGDCESAIVGGTSLILAPDMNTRLSSQNILSPDGSCKTFSAEANGYGRGEAIVSVFVKSLSAALRDGNPIRSVISGSAANFDGKTNPLTTPSATAQEALIRRAYDVAGISDFSKTAVFECHGTGTATGDPIETKAIAAVFGDHGIVLGAVKPNLGHSEGASGLTAVIKATLALEHKIIPPNIKCWPLNPKIPFESAKLTVPSEPMSWPAGRDERVSINSFGVGGSNAHTILESATSYLESRRAKPEATKADNNDTPQLLLFSAKTAYSLKEMTTKYQAWMSETPPADLADVSYTLANRREHNAHRSFAIASGESFNMATSLPSREGSGPSSIVMVFNGQGAAWPQCGRDLLLTNPTFTSTIRKLQAHLKTLGAHAPTWSIEEELLKPARTSRIYEAEFSQPLCTALQIGLVDALAALGVRPSAVVGHSSGEIGAAYAAGALAAEEAITVAYYRGVTPDEQKHQKGGMVAVGLGWDEAAKFLVPGAVIACDNSHSSVTLSGDLDALETVTAAIKQTHPAVPITTLKVEKAYHSHQMLSAGGAYRGALENAGVVGKMPAVPFFSSVTGSRLVDSKLSQLGPKYWEANMVRPVLFKAAVGAILAAKDVVNEVFVELGPHSALAGPLRQILTAESSKAPYVATLVRRQNSAENLLQAIGKLFVLQVPLDLANLVPSGAVCVSGLPCYPWDHQRRYFFESRLAKAWRGREYPEHDLLGTRLAESTSFDPTWRNLLQVNVTPWLIDHKVGESIVFPFAGYVSIAAEACRQVTGIDDGVSFRNISVSSALVLDENASTEIVTTLRRVRLTDKLDSEWWEFSVASHNGHIWTKHCWGEVRGETAAPSVDVAEPMLDLPRRVEGTKWYDMAREQGLTYGPTFNTMEDVKTSTQWPHRATAKARNNRWGDEAEYHIHPIILDTQFQLLSCALTHGISRTYQRTVASSIENMTLMRCSDDMLQMSVISEPTAEGITGCGTVYSGSRPVLQVTNYRGAAFEEASVEDESNNTSIAARCVWAPQADFKALGDLIQPLPRVQTESSELLDELSLLAIAHSHRVATNIAAATDVVQAPSHLAKYKEWLAQTVAASDLSSWDESALMTRFSSLLARLDNTPSATAAKSVASVMQNMGTLLRGQTTSLDILNADDGLTQLMTFTPSADYTGFLRCCAHTKPSARVLEFSAGPGEVTASHVRSLVRPDGSPLFSRYSISTSSPTLKDTLKGIPNLEFVTLNAADSLVDQGLEDARFDLIIAPGVVTASENMRVTLQHLREVLSPTGRLLIEEARPRTAWRKFVLGTMQRWWAHAEDDRADGPAVDDARWSAELSAAGFADVEKLDLGRWSNYLAAARPEQKPSPVKRITLLCCAGAESPAAAFVAELETRGYLIDRCVLEQTPPVGQDVVAMLDEGEPFFENIDSEAFMQFKEFVRAVHEQGAGILWVTRPASVGCTDPRWAQAIGAMRTLRSELSVDIATCEMESLATTQDSAVLLAEVLAKFQTRREDGVLGPDYEYAVRSGEVLVNRIFPFSLEQELVTMDQPNEAEACVTMTQPGLLNTLTWSSTSAVDPKDDEIELEVHATGLNFRDVLVGMKIIPSAKEPIFGYEAAGIVRRVGKKVTKLSPGDRAIIVGAGTFSTVVTISEILCEKLPDNISFNDAAGIGTIFSTAVYSLTNLVHITKGQSVLIHSGAGGVGLAAIQVAQMLGAEIYTTVGSEVKVKYLMDTFGIPRNRIFNSRDTSFVDDLLRETEGKGADVVLNSLSGELLHATWKCVAKWGTMIEIGKRDLLENAKLSMNHFLDNRTYCCLDVDQMRNERPEINNRFILDCCADGRLKPVRVDQVFPASAILDAFRYMQGGKHIGKIVIQLRDDNSKLLLDHVDFTKRAQVQFDGDASYLLIGGLGGLGRAMSVWMVERGAKHLTFLARSAGKGAHDESFRREVESMGCSVQFVRGDVSKAEDVARAIDGVDVPLKGIVQMSMVLRDSMFEDMSIEDWDTAVRPKVQGTWNLHNVTVERGLKLDFFLLFSSLSGVLGQIGQANYAGANTFLDAFVQYRESLGLPCSAIDLGAMEGIGYLAENQELLRKMQGSGWRPVREAELLESLNLAMMPPAPGRKQGSGSGSFVLGVAPTTPLSSPDSSTRLRKDRRMAIYHNTSSGSGAAAATNDGLRVFLASIKSDPGVLDSPESVTLLGTEIGRKLAGLLLLSDQTVDLTVSTADLGLDSLVAVELRGWWKLTFGFDISTLEMLSMGTLEALGKRAADGLKSFYGA